MESSSLLDLPTEIWTYICELAVIEDAPISIFSSMCPKRNERKVMQPGITRTCRAIRTHALPVFYQQNSFIASQSISMTSQIVRWFKAIGWTNRSQLQHLYLRNSWKETVDLMDQACVEANISLPERKRGTVPGTEMELVRLVFCDLDWMVRRRRLPAQSHPLSRFSTLVRRVALSLGS